MSSMYVPIAEGGCHVGWYKMYQLKDGFQCAIQTLKYDRTSDHERVWEIAIVNNGEICKDLTEKLARAWRKNKNIWVTSSPYKHNENMKVVTFLEKDLDQILGDLIDEYNVVCQKPSNEDQGV